jgi:hypothetical protein
VGQPELFNVINRVNLSHRLGTPVTGGTAGTINTQTPKHLDTQTPVPYTNSCHNPRKTESMPMQITGAQGPLKYMTDAQVLERAREIQAQKDRRVAISFKVQERDFLSGTLESRTCAFQLTVEEARDVKRSIESQIGGE